MRRHHSLVLASAVLISLAGAGCQAAPTVRAYPAEQRAREQANALSRDGGHRDAEQWVRPSQATADGTDPSTEPTVSASTSASEAPATDPTAAPSSSTSEKPGATDPTTPPEGEMDPTAPPTTEEPLPPGQVSPTTPPAQPKPSASNPPAQPVEPDVGGGVNFPGLMAAINAERAKAGAKALVRSTAQEPASRKCATSNLKNSPPGSLNLSHSLAGCTYENLWATTAATATASEITESWMNSAGHRRAMLDPNITTIAIGYASDPSRGLFVSARFDW